MTRSVGPDLGMKLAVASISCLSLALGACAKARPAPTQPTPSATAPAASDGISFPAVSPKVGDTVTETNERTMAATVELGPTQRVHMLSSEQRTELKQVVARDGDIVTKLKVTHRSVTSRENLNGKPHVQPTPTVGKTYLVWRAGGELKVSYVDGTAPPAAEREEVRKGNRSVGRPASLERIMTGRVWKIGERFELTAAQLAELNQVMAEDEPSLTAMALTLRTVDDAVATMAMTMTIVLRKAGDDMSIELAGTVKLDRKTGRPLELTGTGPFAGVAKLKMVGTMSMKTRYLY